MNIELRHFHILPAKVYLIMLVQYQANNKPKIKQFHSFTNIVIVHDRIMRRLVDIAKDEWNYRHINSLSFNLIGNVGEKIRTNNNIEKKNQSL